MSRPPRRAPPRPRPPAAADAAVPAPLSAPERERLLSLRHTDPHHLLGAHASPEGLVVRVLRPDAGAVRLLLDGHPPLALPRTDPAGLFEGLVGGVAEVRPYRLELSFAEGRSAVIRDPYAFLPTLGELDLHLFGRGQHELLHAKMGAHVLEAQGVSGVSFSVWAPNAQGVSVVGDWNRWDGRIHPMRVLGGSGVWELFVPGLEAGPHYKFEMRGADGQLVLKGDPLARRTELPPGTASIIARSEYRFGDQAWRESQAAVNPQQRPLSIYEVHLGSWRAVPEEGSRPLNYRELADTLGDYVAELGFTHIELLPITEHPFGGSWGYQVGNFYAPTSRYGEPDDLRYLVDRLHQRGIGVILDWVPAHFPKDQFALGRFDGTALYEHADPRQGEHPDWGTYVFNFGRNEVLNFLLGSALYWLESLGMDGLRLDAVASMLYLDYSRAPGQWVPNAYGGNENLEAIHFLRRLNEVAYRRRPGVLMIAEESTAWPGVSRPTYAGGLGFGFKWNMGWMHDTLRYFTKDPIHRRYHHNDLTFGLLYAWSEHFILPLSHDEVVHGKGSLLDKMPGDRWQKFANLRALYGHMWGHPGAKLLFMGGEFGQWREWSHDRSLDWHLLAGAEHRGLQRLVGDLNRAYRAEPALWEADSDPASFYWIDVHSADDNVLAYARVAPSRGRQLVCIGNFSPVVRHGYRVGLPRPGRYEEILNTDAAIYGGSNQGNSGGVWADPWPWHGQPYSAALTLPPLAVLWLRVPEG
ncbi:MAG: 1,4-alpha-glucan branching protein GlgB [Candidatus Lambdaproteobacteria bacterium]|nr:1,4-alpha-glucan branching protein GlgB [Candidatus Lambdaproteobacteria bacterium]